MIINNTTLAYILIIKKRYLFNINQTFYKAE
jgi:hypothetical protein